MAGKKENDRSGLTRRGFAAAGAGAALAAGLPRVLRAADAPLRVVGLAGSVIDELQARASSDLGFEVKGRALGYGALLAAMANPDGEYDVAQGHFNDMDALIPTRVFQPIDTARIADWTR